MAERPRYIVDASVAVRWYVGEPPFVEQAVRLLDDYREHRINLLAPDNLFLEVTGAIHQAVVARRIRSAQGEHFVEDLLAWRIPVVGTPELILPAYRLSVRLGCSFYDAIYLSLAERESIPFVHADQRLRNTLAHRFPLALWIEDYLSVMD